jgi:BirA family biotin operon repressor/biotin-[acetyl-CoA-carboxylase] ligase
MPFDQEIRDFQRELETSCFGRRLCALETTTSTNRVAADLAADTAGEGLLVVADQQTGGRGRLGRQWFSPPGQALLFSLLLRPHLGQEKFPQLAALTAISLHQTLTAFLPKLPLSLKWPNDLLANGRKISGILCEAGQCPGQPPHVVVGLGLNVSTPQEDFPPDLQGTASSLLALSGELLPRYHLLAHFLSCLESNYHRWQDEGSLQGFLSYWRRFDALHAQPVRVDTPGGQLHGLADGMHEDGRLRLLLDGKPQLVYAGDVIHARKE